MALVLVITCDSMSHINNAECSSQSCCGHDGSSDSGLYTCVSLGCRRLKVNVVRECGDLFGLWLHPTVTLVLQPKTF